MITPGDELHVHQTADPIAVAGTDRNFYDRSFFSAYHPDGSLYLAVAFGIYPHLNVVDAHVSVVRDGVQECLHLSKILYMDRTDLSVGPLRIEVVEPLHRLRIVLAEAEGLALDLELVGRSFPYHEPRFTHRIGPRTFMDYTRLSQGMRVQGRVTVNGTVHELPDGSLGVRDRSWGIRSVGAPDPQPHTPGVDPQFFWVWAPMHLPDATAFFHVCADRTGRAWNTRAALCPDGSGADGHLEGSGRLEVDLEPGTRWARSASLATSYEDGRSLTYDITPVGRFQMRGIGYFHATWGHGTLHGELAVERETINLAEADPRSVFDLHIQALSEVAIREGGTGLGVLEQLVIGPYDPWGLTGLS